MKNITELLFDVYQPHKAIVFYQSCMPKDSSVYVEAYDMDGQGKPINARPLSLAECGKLAELMRSSVELQTSFLQPKGLLPEKVLYVHTLGSGYAIWYTPAQTVDMYFKESLGIANGKAIVPAMVWKADRDSLYVYALKTKGRPNEKTKLFAAPYFNIHANGSVCMGTVSTEHGRDCSLEEFISKWEYYFWNSKFSHLINEYSPVNGNIVQLWQQQVNTGRSFPTDILNKANITIKNLIV